MIELQLGSRAAADAGTTVTLPDELTDVVRDSTPGYPIDAPVDGDDPSPGSRHGSGAQTVPHGQQSLHLPGIESVAIQIPTITKSPIGAIPVGDRVADRMPLLDPFPVPHVPGPGSGVNQESLPTGAQPKLAPPGEPVGPMLKNHIVDSSQHGFQN